MASHFMKEIGSSLWVLALLLGIWPAFWPARLVSGLTMGRVQAKPYNVLPLRLAGILMLLGGLSGLLETLMHGK